MEDEPERLDWGNEEEELHMSFDAHKRSDYGRGGDFDDAEDAVSLGGDDDDDAQVYAYQPRQDDNHKRSGSTPKTLTNNFHQYNQETQKSPSTSPQKPPTARQSSPQRPSLLRSHSLSKLTHALPPKPVAVVTGPYVHHSDPSIIEATAMSKGRSDREKKNNSSIAKSLSSGESDPLPPNWELRSSKSREGAHYYYHIVTHESTWNRPSDNTKSSPDGQEKIKTLEPRSGLQKPDSTETKPSEKRNGARTGRSDADSQLPILSYQDRHYRPGGDIIRSGPDNYRPDERHSGAHTPRSYTPPPSPRPERARSPSLRHHEQDRHPSSRSQSTRYDSRGNHNQLKPLQREDTGSQTQLLGRHWDSSRDSPPPTPRQTRVSSNAPAQIAANFETPTFRGPNGDIDVPPTTRHRSLSPRMRGPPPSQASQPRAPALEVTNQAATPRHRSRFDQTEQSYRSSTHTREHDNQPQADINRRNDQSSPLIVERSRVENSGSALDDFAPDNSAGHRSSLTDRNRPSISRSERTISPPPPAMPLDQSHSRQRPHLVLQNTGEAPAASQERRSPAPLSSVNYRDSGSQALRSAYSDHVPSTRSHQQPITPRDTKRSEFSQTSRAPAFRGPRDQFHPNESSTLRDRDVPDVDQTASRTSFKSSDTHIRAGTGMYADREQGTDVPKGPKAMSNKLQTNLVYPTNQDPTLFVERNMVVHDRTGRFRERSPPPHQSSNDGWERHRDPPERRPQSDNFIAREDHVNWRSNSTRLDDSLSRRRSEQGIEGSQTHTIGYPNQNRRKMDSYRPTEPIGSVKPFSANDVPIGNRAGPRHFGLDSQPEASYKAGRQGPSDSMESVRDRDSRVDFPRRDSYESSPHYNAKGLSEDTYRNASSKNPDSAQYRRPRAAENDPMDFEPRPSMSMESYQNNTSAAYPRRDSSRVELEPDHRSAPRIWIPRQTSPPPLNRTRSSGREEYRPPSPSTRETAVVSPTWGPLRSSNRSEGRHPQAPGRTHNQYDDAPRSAVMDVDEQSRHRQDPLTDRISRGYSDLDVEHPKTTTDLERRLSERYDNRYEASYRRQTPSMPVPSSRRDREFHPNDVGRHSDHHSRPQKFNDERRSPEWNESERRVDPVRPSTSDQHVERGGGFEGGRRSTPPHDSARPSRIRRRFGPPIHSNAQLTADAILPNDTRTSDHGPQRLPQSDVDREHVQRRGGSLLDRLSLDAGPGVAEAMASASLRDRVMIPAKRDREEMLSGTEAMIIDSSFELDDGSDRRNRRRNGKLRRGKGRIGGGS